MLFAVKNSLGLSLLLLALFVVAALGLKEPLGLDWNWHYQASVPRDLLLGTLALAVSDGCGHGLLLLLVGQPYRQRYQALADYFRPQHVPQIVAGGLLAGGEELVFRGTLLEWLRTAGGLSSAAAVALTAVVFGLLHLIPRRELAPFALWAVWEGVLLGTVYVWSGSLLVVVVLHVLHDIAGFGMFALQRRLGAVESPHGH